MRLYLSDERKARKGGSIERGLSVVKEEECHGKSCGIECYIRDSVALFVYASEI
jgi:hypothetical protein